MGERIQIQSKKSYSLILLLVVLTVAGINAYQPKEVNVYLVGDSTMSEKDVDSYPETGWGMPFDEYFVELVHIENHARNGRSTRTFIQEGLWKPIQEKLKEGDYVFIQFGHNDEVQTKPRSTKPNEYKKYLRQYIAETRAKKAIPILLTPISRRRFDDEGKPKKTHEYSPLMRDVAEEENVLLIDMDKKSIAMLGEIGEDKSTLLFLQLKPGQNPNYPDGITDNTHFSETGARMMAELVLRGIQELNLDLAEYIRKGEG